MAQSCIVLAQEWCKPLHHLGCAQTAGTTAQQLHWTLMNMDALMRACCAQRAQANFNALLACLPCMRACSSPHTLLQQLTCRRRPGRRLLVCKSAQSSKAEGMLKPDR